MQLSDEFPVFFDQARIKELEKVTSTWILRYNFLCRFKELKKSERFSLLVENILTVQKEVHSLIPDPLLPSVKESESWRVFYQASTLLHQLMDENVGYKSGRSFQKKGDRKIISLVDPDARSGQKSKTNRFTGYKVAVAMTKDRFYPAVETLPGNQSDMVQAIPLITETMETSGETPKAAAFDLGFNSLKNRQELHELGIQPGIEFEPRINPRNPGFYTVEDFQFESKTLEVTCPAGQTTNIFTLNKKTDMMVFRFARKTCDTCLKKKGCTSSKSGRTVQFSPRVELLKSDRDFLQTIDYEELRCARWGLEGTFGTAKGSHNLGKSPYHGLKKTSLHNRLVGIVINLKRFTKLLLQEQNTPVSYTCAS